MSAARWFDLQVPDLASLTDEEIEGLFPSFDGRWSRQTKMLLARAGVDRLDLDANWASMPVDWRCGPCGRAKTDLARVSEHGVLICNIDWHHDHLRNHGKKVLRDKANRPTEVDAFRRWYAASDLCLPLTERFHPAYTCIDCNAADGKAKRDLAGEIHPDFSFSPMEIASFITLRPGQSHGVDVDRARVIWRDVEAEVADLIAFAGVLARRIAEGRHQRKGVFPRIPAATDAIFRDLRREGNPAIAALGQLPYDLELRSVQRDGFRSARKARARTVRIPTLADLAAYTATQDADAPWVWHDPDWTCAACDRSRFECLRASGRGKWTGRLHRFRVYADETDAAALYWRNGWADDRLTFRTHRDVFLCQDCRLIITDVNKGATDASDDCLTLTDLRRLVGDAEPHVRPEIDLDEAAGLADANLEHIGAARDYGRHFQKCRGAAPEYEHLTKRCGVDLASAGYLVLERLERLDIGDEELSAFVAFVLAESARFSAEEDARWRARQARSAIAVPA